MKFDVVFTSEANSESNTHLLKHYCNGDFQEDLCFALWYPSTGNSRFSALINEIILPEKDERSLHGNASFEPRYLSRALKKAVEKKAGLAFMHSHPTPGWQGMSDADIKAEQDVIAYPAGATGFPLLGLTIGTDGYWSARFWKRNHNKMNRHWCDKVRIIGSQSYKIYFNDSKIPSLQKRNILRRTFDTWGNKHQNTISRLKIGIVGVGSVGCIVAESLARIGVEQITIIDPDKVKEHNLDRLLYGTEKDIGKLKVDLASLKIKKHSTAKNIQVNALPLSIHNRTAYEAALDCDVIFSCVDRPIPRDVLNYIAQAHLIPVIDGGVAIKLNKNQDSLFSAHWRAHIITPYHQCLRCNGQYNSSSVVSELDGSLDNPSYIESLSPENQDTNQNVFPFSLSVAGMEVNLLLRYILSEEWWPLVRQQDYQFITGKNRVINNSCNPNCSFIARHAQGDKVVPHYIIDQEKKKVLRWHRTIQKFFSIFDKIRSKIQY